MNPTTLVLFAHGKESGPWGRKILHLAEIAKRHGAKVESPDYSDLMNPDDRVSRLLTLQLPPHDRLVLVGSSMGGYVSTVASVSLKPAGLFLMAPAVYLPGYAVGDPRPHAGRTSVVFGWKDENIPVEYGIRFAQAIGCPLHVLDADHRLDSSITEIGVLFEHFLNTL